MRASLCVLKIILSKGKVDDVGRCGGQSGVKELPVCVEGQCYLPPLRGGPYLKTPRMWRPLITLNLTKTNKDLAVHLPRPCSNIRCWGYREFGKSLV